MQIIKGGPRSGNYLQVIYELLAASGKKLDDSGRRWREERWRGARSREGWICPEKQPRNGAFTKFDPIVQAIELIYSPPWIVFPEKTKICDKGRI